MLNIFAPQVLSMIPDIPHFYPDRTKRKKPPGKEKLFVPEAGIEPAWPQWPKDFKSFVSTYFTIRAAEKKPPCN